MLAAAIQSALAAGVWGSLGTLPSAYGEKSTRADEEIEQQLDERRRRAIRRGCDYLAKQQRKGGQFGETDKAVVALTALSVLALMAGGSSDGRGPHGQEVRAGINFLLGLIRDRSPDVPWHEGYFYHPHDPSSRMHGQGYATLALAMALGTSTGKRYREIRQVLEKAVHCIEQAQTITGGFGYDPVSTGMHEGSVTVTVAQGLRAARDAGLLVSEQVVKKGLNYLRRSQNTDGSFRYSLYVDRSTYALTAAAISSFFLYGRYTDDPRDDSIQRGLDYMMKEVGKVIANKRLKWYYYGNFYAAWAFWQKDGNEWDPRSGGYWARWHRRVYPDLLDLQRHGDGSWDELVRFDFGDVLPTAFAVLTLAIPDEELPIFQR